MVARMKGKTEGFEEAYRLLKTLPKVTQKNALRRSLLPAANLYEAMMRSLAPQREGKLKASVRIDQRPKLGQSLARAKRKSGDKSIEMHVIADDPAAIRQEFGTSFHRAQPFGIPAYEATRGQMISMTADAVREEIGGAIARQAKKGGKRG
jgi:HK97 gp10 family phage protein